MKRGNINVNDRQLVCAKIYFPEGQDYLKGMAAAANYACVNRSSMTFLCRQVLWFLHYLLSTNFCRLYCLVEQSMKPNVNPSEESSKHVIRRAKISMKFFLSVCFKRLWKLMPQLLIKPWQMLFQSRKWFRFIFGVVI